ncbi:transposase, partial [Glaciihabitans sp. UYNi722]
MSRTSLLTDEQWDRVGVLMPRPAAKGGRPFQ